MKVKTIILTFLLMMSSPIIFGQNRTVWEEVRSYQDLTGAIEAASEDGDKTASLLLKNDIEYSGRITIPAGITVIIDINGFNLTSTDDYAFRNEGTLTIKDEGQSINKPKISATGILNAYSGAATLTLENVIVENNSGSGVVINNKVGGTVNITGGQIIAAGNANSVQNDGIMTMNGTVVKTEHRSFVIGKGSELALTNTKIYDPNGGYRYDAKYLSAGEINAYADGTKINEYSETFFVKAEVDSEPFPSLKAAVDYALNNNKTEVNLLYGDVLKETVVVGDTPDDGLTINGNNNTVKVVATTNQYASTKLAFWIKNGKITLNNLNVESEDCHVLYLGNDVNEANINECTINGWSAMIVNAKDAKINITDSHLVGTNVRGTGAQDYGNSYGTIVLKGDIGETVVNMTRGSVTAKSDENHSIQGILTHEEIQGDSYGNAKFNINAEMFVEGKNTRYVFFVPERFTSPATQVSADYAEDLLAEGWATSPVKGAEGKMISVNGYAVATINGVSYTSLADAFKAVKDDETIEIVAEKDHNIGSDSGNNLSYPIADDDNGIATEFTIKTKEGVTFAMADGGKIFFNGGVKVTLEDSNIDAILTSSVGNIVLSGENNIKTLMSNGEKGKLSVHGGKQTIKYLGGELNVTGEPDLNIGAVVNSVDTYIVMNGATLTEKVTLPEGIRVTVAENENNINSAFNCLRLAVNENATLNVNADVTVTQTVTVNGVLNVTGSSKFAQKVGGYSFFLGNGATVNVEKGSSFQGDIAKVKEAESTNLTFNGNASFKEFNNNGTVKLSMDNNDQIFTTPEITNVIAKSTAGYKVIYKNGAYVVVKNHDVGSEFVLLRKQNGTDIGYTTLQDAINASEEGDVIQLLPNIVKEEQTDATTGVATEVEVLKPSVNMYGSYVYGKNVTITTDGDEVMVNWANTDVWFGDGEKYAEYLFVGRGGQGEEGYATLTFDNAIINSATAEVYSGYSGLNISGAKRTGADEPQSAQSVFNGSVIVTGGSEIMVDYIYVRNEMTIESGSEVYVPQGIIVAGRPASESTVKNEDETDYIDATATLTIAEGATLNVTKGHPNTGLGLLEQTGEQGLGVMNVYGTFVNEGDFIVRGKGKMNIYGGTFKVGEGSTANNAPRLFNGGNVDIYGNASLTIVAGKYTDGDNGFYNINDGAVLDNVILKGSYAKLNFNGESTIKGSDLTNSIMTIKEDATLNLEGEVLGGGTITNKGAIYMPFDPKTTFATKVSGLEDVITTDKDYKVYYDGVNSKYVVVSEGLSAYDNVLNVDQNKGYRTLAEALAEVGENQTLRISRSPKLETGVDYHEGEIVYPADDATKYTNNFTIETYKNDETGEDGTGYIIGKIAFKKDVNVRLNNVSFGKTTLYVEENAKVAFTGTNSVEDIIGNKNSESANVTVEAGATLNLVQLIANIDVEGSEESITSIKVNQVGAAEYGNNIYMHGVTLDENTVIKEANVKFVEGTNTVTGAVMTGLAGFVVDEGATVTLNEAKITDDEDDRNMNVNGAMSVVKSYVAFRYVNLGAKAVLNVTDKCDFAVNNHELYVRSALNIADGSQININNSNVYVGNHTYTNGSVGPELKLVGEAAKFTTKNEIKYEDNSDKGYKIFYDEAKTAYIVVPSIYEGFDAVAIGSYGYPTLKEALEVANDGDKLVLQSAYKENNGVIDMQGVVLGKKVTITGDKEGFEYKADWRQDRLYIAYNPSKQPLEGDNDASLTFEYVKIKDYSADHATQPYNGDGGIIVSCANKDGYAFNGELYFDNSIVEAHYIADRYIVGLDNSTVTVDGGFVVGHRNKAEYVQDGTAKLNLTNSSTFEVTGEHRNTIGYEYKGEINIDNSSYLVSTGKNLNITADGTVNIIGGKFTVESNGVLTNNGTVNVSGAATLAVNKEIAGNGNFYMKGVTLRKGNKLIAPSNDFYFFASSTGGEGTRASDNIVKGSVEIEGSLLYVGSSVEFGYDHETTASPVGSYIEARIVFKDVVNKGIIDIKGVGGTTATTMFRVSNEFKNNASRFIDEFSTYDDGSNLPILNVAGKVDIGYLTNDGVVNFNQNADVNPICDIQNNHIININTGIENNMWSNGTQGVINIASGASLTSNSTVNLATANEGKIYLGYDDKNNQGASLVVAEAQTGKPELAVGIDGDTYEVYYDGTAKAYKVRAIRYVAQIEREGKVMKYESLEDAVDAAKSGETITLLDVADYPVDMSAAVDGKDVIITTEKDKTVEVDWSQGSLYVGRHGTGTASVGDATLTFKDAKLKSTSSGEIHNNGLNISGKHYDGHAYNGTVKVLSSEIEVDYILVRNEMIIENSTVVVEGNNGYTTPAGSKCNVLIGGRPHTETGAGDHATATLKLKNSTLNVAQHIRTNYEGKGKMDVDASSTVTATSVYVPGQSWLTSTGNIFAHLDEEVQNLIELKGGVYTEDVNNFCHSDYVAYPCEYNDNSGYWQVRPRNGSQEFKLVGGNSNEGKGWNWISSYMNTESFNVTSLQNGLGKVGTIISSQDGTFNSYIGGAWNGTIVELTNTSMYKVQVTDDVTFKLEGDFVDYTKEVILLKHGWNWIGYPVSTPMSISDAFPTPLDGDAIKTNKVDESTGAAIGTMAVPFDDGVTVNVEWFEEITLEPGCGYMYYNSGDARTFTYPTVVKPSTNSRATKEANRWSAPSGYASNMTMFAMVNIDGELVDGNYEVAAFANGEVRGSARPIYIESLDAYALFMIIAGDKVEELTFKYYDVNYGTEYELDNRINYSGDAVVGSFDEPYILTMNITDIEEVTLSDVNIYPNPTTTGVQVNLDATCEKVEIFNALGVKVAEYQNVDSIDAFETAGIYVIRLTNGGEIKHTRLVVR